VRLNNTRQTLPLLLLLSFSPPSTSSCPQPLFSPGFILQPTLSLSLPSPPFPPTCLTFFSLYARHLPNPLGARSAHHFHFPGGFTFLFVLFFMTPFASLYPLRFMSSFYCFNFALLCCIICCQVRLPVFVTHICKSLFKDNTLLFKLVPVYVCS